MGLPRVSRYSCSASGLNPRAIAFSASSRASVLGVSDALIMKSRSEIGDRLAEALTCDQAVQCDDVTACSAACVTSEVAVNERDAQRCMFFVSSLVYGATDHRPVPARSPCQEMVVLQVGERARQRRMIECVSASRRLSKERLIPFPMTRADALESVYRLGTAISRSRSNDSTRATASAESIRARAGNDGVDSSSPGRAAFALLPPRPSNQRGDRKTAHHRDGQLTMRPQHMCSLLLELARAPTCIGRAIPRFK